MSSTTDNDCIFCKIISGQIPSCRVYEDEATIAFLDINPIVKGHTLVVPKGHYPTILDLPAEFGQNMVHTAKIVGNALMQSLDAQGFNIIQNNFGAAGQMVFHMHWHLIPRFDNDQLFVWQSVPYKDMGQMQDMAATIGRHTADV